MKMINLGKTGISVPHLAMDGLNKAYRWHSSQDWSGRGAGRIRTL